MTLLFALLLAVSPVEQSYGPYARPMNGGDAAVAPARGGALLAWSEAGRIRVALLDTRGRIASEIHTLPATSARVNAVAPAAASDGDSYFVAWLELESGLERPMGVRVARDGSPVGTPRPYGRALTIASNDFGLRLVWDGAAYRLWASQQLLTIDRNGNVLASTAAELPSGAAASNGVLATSSARIAFVGCGFSWCTYSSHVTWTVGSRSESLQIGFASGSPTQRPHLALTAPPTTVAAAGDRFVVAWPVPAGIRYLLTGDGMNLVSAMPDTSVRPGIACDDTRCVVAYAQSNDVHAFAFPIDRLTGPELMTIAATERTERAPQVHVLGEGRFLVTYRSDGTDGARLNARLVTFGTPKRRAAR